MSAKASNAGVSYQPFPASVAERFTNGLIIEECENLIFPDRATDAAAELFETSCRLASRQGPRH